MKLADFGRKREREIDRPLAPERVRRVASTLRWNLMSDLSAQITVLVVGAVWVRSPWLWLLWAVRWVTTLIALIAARSLRRGNVERPILGLIVGHSIAALMTVTIAPVFGPVAILVLVGDVVFATMLSERLRRFVLLGSWVVATGCAALSLQAWIGLVERAPVAVVAAVLVLHSLINGVLMARRNGDFFLGLRRIGDRLARSDERLQFARENEQRLIAETLRLGPLADLRQLREDHQRIAREEQADPTGAASIADASAVHAQDALRSLRRISHGIFPEELQSGLGAALRALTEDVAIVCELHVSNDRWDPAIESVFYATAADLVRIAVASDATLTFRVARDGTMLRLLGRIEHRSENDLPELSPLIADRVAAIGGEWSVRRGDGSLALEVITPTELRPLQLGAGSHPIAPMVVRHDTLLREVIRFSMVAVLLGLVCSFGVLVVTRTWAGLSVFGILVVPLVLLLVGRQQLDQGRYNSTVAVLSATSCVAAIALSALIPELATSAAIVATLPLFLASPHLDRRGLDVIAVVQTLALAAVAVLRFVNQPLIPSVVPKLFPQIVLLISTVGLFGIVLHTVTRITQTIEDATEVARVAAQRAADEADAQRQAIERDLHDGAQQQFVALSMQFRTLAKLLRSQPARANVVLAVMESHLESARNEMAALADGSSLPGLDGANLKRALRNAASLAGAGVGVSVVVNNADHLDAETARTVYFCCHEGMQNAMKHGGTPLRVDVTVECAASYVYWQVSDNGIGFDASAKHATHGFRSIAGRVAAAGGTFSVTSQAGEGTVLRGTLPRFTTQPVASTEVVSTGPVK